MEIYVGVDGGGSKTKVIIMDKKGNVIGSGVSGPSSVDTVSINETSKNIKKALRQACYQLPKYSIKSVFLGLGGIVTNADRLFVINTMLKELPNLDSNVIIDANNDVFNALVGGLAQAEEGMVVIIGTGSVAFGLKNGKTHRSGGYGFQESEPGSAYDLGRKVIALVAKSFDGRIAQSSLVTDVRQDFSIHDIATFITWHTDLFNNRTKTAELAVYVTKHAKIKDPYALEIINNATNELKLMVEAVNDRLRLSNKVIAVVGSLGNDEFFFKEFKKKVNLTDSDFKVFSYILEPAIGSGLQALKQSGYSIDENAINLLKNHSI